jgi:hypothetical protein
MTPSPTATVEKPLPDVTPINRVEAWGALILLALGLLFWWWMPPHTTEIPLPTESGEGWSGGAVVMINSAPGVAVPLFYALVVAAALTYWWRLGIALRRPVIVGAALIMVAAAPFAIFPWSAASVPLFLALMAGTILWLALAGGNLIAVRPDATLAIDAINQGLIVPLRNLSTWFQAVGRLFGRSRSHTQIIIGLIGSLVALPVLLLVVGLLAGADSAFAGWLNVLAERVGEITLGPWLARIVLGILTAVYLFASLYGNAHNRGTNSISRQQVDQLARRARQIRLAALTAPIIALTLVYLIFLVGMLPYLTGTFGGVLPAGYTYAEYARRGFFELVAVSFINLLVIGFTYLFARRSAPNEHVTNHDLPIFLRIAGVILSGETILLVIIAVSKMLLYIGSTGLTELRVYTLLAMIVLGISFGAIIVWMVRRFRLTQLIIAIAVAGLLAINWANTDGIIARYNVDAYLDGRLTTIDVDYLVDGLNEAARPAIADLADLALDPVVREAAKTALTESTAYGLPGGAVSSVPWYDRNVFSELSRSEA